MSVRTISPELRALADKELNEEESRVPEDIAYIKSWLKQQKYINARTDDQWILAFLRGCKFSLERTKEKLDTFYTMKTIVPEFFSNRDPMLPEIQELLNLGEYLPLPKSKEPNSPRIILLRGGCYDANQVNPATLFKMNMMINDILMNEDDNYIIAGISMVQDMEGITLQHMFSMSPSLLKKAMTIFQDAYPVRPKGFHFINIPSFFEAMYNLFKPFLNEKMKKRMVVHEGKNFDEMYKVIPKYLLPKDYGGDGPTIDELTVEWKAKVESYRDWYLDDEQYRTDEKKRPGKPKTSDEYFGLEGSFRKLNVD